MQTHTVGPGRRAFHRLADLVFPPVCPACRAGVWRASHQGLCPACAIKNPPIRPPYCKTCGRPLAEAQPHACQDCLLDVPPYRLMRSAFAYRGALRRAVLAFKMYREVSRARALAGLLLQTETIGIRWEAYDLVVPVPLHDNRLRWRGFNQCTLLLREIAARRPIVWTDRLLVRIRDTTPQVMVLHSDRHKNVAGAFFAEPTADLTGASVLIVDDITTTGATLAECAKALATAGAQVVDAAVLARPLSQ